MEEKAQLMVRGDRLLSRNMLFNFNFITIQTAKQREPVLTATRINITNLPTP